MNETNFVGYEYRDFTVKRNLSNLYADSLENFGWEAEGSSNIPGRPDCVQMKFRRDRKIRNKAELTRLQRQFEACVSELQSLEKSKYIKGSAAAYGIGVIGTAFMAGSVFAVTAGNIPLCIILAIPGFFGWILPYLCYRTLLKNKTAEVTPLMDQKYDEIYETCEKASALLV